MVNQVNPVLTELKVQKVLEAAWVPEVLLLLSNWTVLQVPPVLPVPMVTMATLVTKVSMVTLVLTDLWETEVLQVTTALLVFQVTQVKTA